MKNQIGRFWWNVGLRFLLCLSVASLSIGMTESYKKRVHQKRVNQMFNQSQREYPNVVAWDQIDPLEFVETLKNWPGPYVRISNPPPVGWINPDQRSHLSQLLHNQETAAAITHPFNNFPPKKRIPVGALVQYMVQFDSLRNQAPETRFRVNDPGDNLPAITLPERYRCCVGYLTPGPFIDNLPVSLESQNKETIQPPHAPGLAQRGSSKHWRVGRRSASR